MNQRRSASLYERLHAENGRLRRQVKELDGKRLKYAARARDRANLIRDCVTQHRRIVDRIKSEHEEEKRALREQIERLKDPN